MTATQAPTPGPLSGEPEQDLCFGCQKTHDVDDLKIGFCVGCERIGKAWSQSLAPTAPVEASGSDLHPATADLVDRFAVELKSKLAKAEAKYGYRDDWSKPDWQDELTESLAEHIQKGDPRDVAAYCAFAWHHNWSTSAASGHLTGSVSPRTENDQPAWTDQDIEDLLSDAIGDSFDMDWTARDGAKAVLAALKREGLLSSGVSTSALEIVRKITEPLSGYSSDDAARRAAFKTSDAALSGLTPAEQKAQAARCGCKGSDDMCPCQNTPDRQTIKDRSNA